MATEKKRKGPLLGQEYLDTFVTVHGTEKNPYHETGKPFQMHPDAAKQLVEKGFATYEPIEPDELEEGAEKV